MSPLVQQLAALKCQCGNPLQDAAALAKYVETKRADMAHARQQSRRKEVRSHRAAALRGVEHWLELRCVPCARKGARASDTFQTMSKEVLLAAKVDKLEEQLEAARSYAAELLKSRDALLAAYDQVVVWSDGLAVSLHRAHGRIDQLSTATGGGQ
jgi:hypothetical protein